MAQFEKLGELTKAQTRMADRETNRIAQFILNRNQGDDGGYMSDLMGTQYYDQDAHRSVEINRGSLQYSITIHVRRTDKD